MAGQDKKRLVRVALVKAESAWGEVDANVRLLEDLARPLSSCGIDVLVTPECFLDGYMVRDRERCTRTKLRACCVSGPEDPAVQRVARLAQSLGCYLVLGASERDAGGVIRNAAYLLDRTSGSVGTYYKTHPAEFYQPGDALPVFQLDFGVVGVVICADRRWPENMRCLRLKGAEMVLVPSWGWHGEGNTTIMRTRAYENGLPVCFAHPNQSLICLPDGNVGAVLESNCPGVLVHDVDLSQNPKAKQTKNKASSLPVQNRRPELYDAIVKIR